MTDHGELARTRATAVNVSVPSAHRAFPRAEIGARDIDERFAERGTPGLVANQWREDVAFLQKKSASHADCFLAFAQINAAGDQAAPIETGQFLLENAGLEHDAEGL